MKKILEKINTTTTRSIVVGLIVSLGIMAATSAVQALNVLPFIGNNSTLIERNGSLTIGDAISANWILEAINPFNPSAVSPNCVLSENPGSETCLDVSGGAAFTDLLIDRSAYLLGKTVIGATLSNGSTTSFPGNDSARFIVQESGAADSMLVSGLGFRGFSGTFSPRNTTSYQQICATFDGALYRCVGQPTAAPIVASDESSPPPAQTPPPAAASVPAFGCGFMTVGQWNQIGYTGENCPYAAYSSSNAYAQDTAVCSLDGSTPSNTTCSPPPAQTVSINWELSEKRTQNPSDYVDANLFIHVNGSQLLEGYGNSTGVLNNIPMNAEVRLEQFYRSAWGVSPNVTNPRLQLFINGTLVENRAINKNVDASYSNFISITENTTILVKGIGTVTP
jgi:hypothetical protein